MRARRFAVSYRSSPVAKRKLEENPFRTRHLPVERIIGQRRNTVNGAEFLP
jgi:hypothetical protein